MYPSAGKRNPSSMKFSPQPLSLLSYPRCSDVLREQLQRPPGRPTEHRAEFPGCPCRPSPCRRILSPLVITPPPLSSPRTHTSPANLPAFPPSHRFPSASTSNFPSFPASSRAPLASPSHPEELPSSPSAHLAETRTPRHPCT